MARGRALSLNPHPVLGQRLESARIGNAKLSIVSLSDAECRDLRQSLFRYVVVGFFSLVG